MTRTVALWLALCVAVLAACSDDTPALDGGARDQRAEGAASDATPPDAITPDTTSPPAARCAAGSRAGAAGSTDGHQTATGLGYNVRTPPGYDPTVGHPLIVVFAGAGGSAGTMEPYTGLTNPALAAGYIIAYADHVSPLSYKGVEDLATIPGDIAATWCVDKARIYLTGHSDGGSVIYIGLFRGYFAATPPAAIAPSAAGINAAVLANAPCPAPPLPVMVLHASNDTLFPGFGREALAFWNACYQCSVTTTADLQGCVRQSGCGPGADVRFCETDGGHGGWPAKNDAMLAFFGQHRR